MAKELRDVVGHLFEVDVLRRVCLQKAASDSGLYFGQLPILQFIHEHPGCTQREIADKIGVTSASVALSTKRMQKSGLLTKEIDSQDLRCNRLELTETGIEYSTPSSPKNCGSSSAKPTPNTTSRTIDSIVAAAALPSACR